MNYPAFGWGIGPFAIGFVVAPQEAHQVGFRAISDRLKKAPRRCWSLGRLGIVVLARPR